MGTYSSTPTFDVKSALERLRRSEQDAAEKLARRRAALDAAGHWHWNDPLHQRLSSVLRRVRQELSEAEAELHRRSRATAEAR